MEEGVEEVEEGRVVIEREGREEGTRREGG